MSRRSIHRDPIEERRKAYQGFSQDEQAEAIWEALALLRMQGIDIGPKANQVLDWRETVKEFLPK